jgi:hypothetical protein
VAAGGTETDGNPREERACPEGKHGLAFVDNGHEDRGTAGPSVGVSRLGEEDPPNLRHLGRVRCSQRTLSLYQDNVLGPHDRAGGEGS